MIWMISGSFVRAVANVSDSGPMISAGFPLTGISTAAVSKLGQ